MVRLTATIIQCIIKVHKDLGPVFLESVYRRALVVELKCAPMSVDVEKEVIIYYCGHEVGRHKLELKTVEELSKATMHKCAPT